MEQFLQSLVPNDILVYIIMGALPLLWIIPYALFAIWWERKISAHMQDRLGPMRTGGWHGWSQSVADMLKLLQKEDIIPAAADKLLYIIAPYIVFVAAYGAYAVIPFSSAYVGSDVNLGLFFILAVTSLAVVGILMGGWSSNNKWSLFGAMRSAAQIVSYEIPSALALLAVVMLAGTLNLQEITRQQSGWFWNWYILQKFPFPFIAFVIYFIGSLAETNRTPFDLPEAESELVAGYMTEYSGMRWAMFMFAEYVNMFSVSAVGATLFLGGWNSPFGDILAGPVWGLFWFLSKGMFLIFLQMWLRWTLPRLRVDQLMYVSWKVLTPWAFACIVGVGLWMVI
jgi:NADH-quinone oxidoreductase subunit H